MYQKTLNLQIVYDMKKFSLNKVKNCIIHFLALIVRLKTFSLIRYKIHVF
jgi:hypothetical protein